MVLVWGEPGIGVELLSEEDGSDLRPAHPDIYGGILRFQGKPIEIGFFPVCAGAMAPRSFRSVPFLSSVIKWPAVNNHDAKNTFKIRKDIW